MTDQLSLLDLPAARAARDEGIVRVTAWGWSTAGVG